MPLTQLVIKESLVLGQSILNFVQYLFGSDPEAQQLKRIKKLDYQRKLILVQRGDGGLWLWLLLWLERDKLLALVSRPLRLLVVPFLHCLKLTEFPFELFETRFSNVVDVVDKLLLGYQ